MKYSGSVVLFAAMWGFAFGVMAAMLCGVAVWG